MEKIFTVGFNAEKVADLGFSNIDLPSLVEKDDSEIHNFIINKFKENEIEKLIFDLSINPVLVIKLAFHIRLSLQELKSKSLLPILFTSTESFQTVIGKCGKWSSIFTTKGIYFAPFSLVKIDIENIMPLKSNEYKNSFLDLIQISPDEIDGKHSIANQWGAFALEQAANTNVLRNDENLKKTFNKLYFKYINAYLFDYKLLEKESHIKGTIYVGNINAIDATTKKVLLIDDEADKGWDLVLRKIFKNADFKIINEKVSDYNSFSNETKQLIEHGNFDLFLVDLRLNGIQEEEFIPIELFSGTNVLKEIKRQNRGNQVIMFTASNKAWNIKPLLDFGSDGYYIKESPEYMFSSKVSESNYLTFKMNVNSCFNRNYLKSIFNSIDKLKIKLNSLIGVYDQKFLNEIIVLLDQSFDAHYNAKDEKQFAYAYVTLYMIIEIINQKFIAKQSDDTYGILDVGNLLDWKFEKEKYSNTGIDVKGNKPPEWQKIAGLYFQKWNKTDKDFIQKIHSLIQKRNGFVHNDKSILEKQNNAGKYINRDVFNKDGFVELFNCIEVLINLL